LETTYRFSRKIDPTVPLTHPIFREISQVADDRGLPAFVIGGYVRDWYLRRPNTDIDIVVAGDAVAVAEELGRRLGVRVSIFKTFGTAMLHWRGVEVEFVGARRESYSENSRKPECTPGTIEDDQLRRDFTINAMAWSLNGADFGTLSDPFGGMDDLEDRIIRTPTDPDVTFSDDPLRMMRAVRFATQLGFDIEDETFEAIRRNAARLGIVSAERITVELNKIMLSPAPSLGFNMLDTSGLLKLVMPEMEALKGVEKVGVNAHKDNFVHTLRVLDNVARRSNDLWLRWAALLHDIGKPATKAYDPKVGWTFHGHEVVGSKMVPKIFRRLRLPLGEQMKFVQKLVFLHLRPIVLAEEVVTDSAVRRLLFEAGDDIEPLMTLCEADITSANDAKVKRYLANFELVRAKMAEIEEKDRVRNFQPPITGDIIMEVYAISPSNVIGEIKEIIKNAILDGEIENDFAQAYSMMERLAAERGLVKVKDYVSENYSSDSV
jgi:poly(A) polymerase